MMIKNVRYFTILQQYPSSYEDRTFENVTNSVNALPQQTMNMCAVFVSIVNHQIFKTIGLEKDGLCIVQFGSKIYVPMNVKNVRESYIKGKK